jgi:predicted O-methyltransferase YrrM
MGARTYASRQYRRVIKKLFPFFQRFGVHVVPNHYYEPVPDTSKLSEDTWSKRSALVGIDIGEKGQMELLAELVSKFKREYDSFPKKKTAVPHEFSFENDSFGPVDAEVLYCMVRHLKPSKILEIGSGNSTYISAKAAVINKEQGSDCELVCIEPFPNVVLRKGFPGLSRLIVRPMQEVPLAEFESLGENDILFIDSSHMLKMGSDVQRIYLEVLPVLKKGVVVHIHDIFLPAEYPRQWVMEHRMFWNEQYLLQAFLTFNERFRVLWAGSYMHLVHGEELGRAFKSFDPRKNRPGSFWMKRR